MFTLLECMHTGSSRMHLETHSGEKSYIYANNVTLQLQATWGTIRKLTLGEKSHICSQCNFASVHTGSLKVHLITNSGEKSYNINNVTLYLSIWNPILEKNRTNANNVTLHLQLQATLGTVRRLTLGKNRIYVHTWYLFFFLHRQNFWPNFSSRQRT